MSSHCPACQADLSNPDAVLVVVGEVPWYKYSGKRNRFKCVKCGVFVRPEFPARPKWQVWIKTIVMLLALILGLANGILWIHGIEIIDRLQRFKDSIHFLFVVFLVLSGLITFATSPSDRSKWNWVIE